jgi:hypothetical protein
MKNLQKKVASAIAAGALLFNTVMPVVAGTTIEISGNGSDSTNKAEVDVEQTTVVSQSNEANIKNTVNASANSGYNDANRNTGGNVSVDTGDATTKVDVANTVNSNQAEVQCCEGDVDVLISGNGDNSYNKVDLDVNHSRHDESGTFVEQENEANIKNEVDADSNTGKNDANRNTGGDVEITTGSATTSVDILNQANGNSAKVSGNNDGVKLSARILDNGADTTNKIYLDYEHSIVLDQDNEANVDNDVNADSDSGKNDANRNTGGEVSIDTGDAKTDVEIDNWLNFNWADVDCGCLLDVLAKIDGNGDDSYNKIEADFEDGLFVEQENSCGEEHHRRGPQGFTALFELGGRRHHDKECLENEVYADADTGKNEVERNTQGEHGVDPSVETGNATTDVVLDNAGNSNVFGGEAPEWDWELPLPGFSFNLNLSFSLSDLLAALLGQA